MISLYLEAQDPDKDIQFYINSPGGSVTAGMAIYDTMQYIKCDVSTICPKTPPLQPGAGILALPPVDHLVDQAVLGGLLGGHEVVALAVGGELDQYIIGQEKAKVALSVAVYNHYKRIFYPSRRYR